MASLSKLTSGTGLGFGTSGMRGPVAEITAPVCNVAVSAFLNVTGHQGSVVLGHDLRPSSPNIARWCAASLAAQGITPLYVGALPTPAIAYYAMQRREPSLVITGSHIPFDRNGIKFYRADGEITKADEQSILHAEVDEPPSMLNGVLPAVDSQARLRYVERYTGFFRPDLLRGKKVAVYQHSSVARDILVEILVALGADKVLELGRSDSFVPVDTEAVDPDTVRWGAEWAAEQGFDVILSTDGDGDRPLIGDERGQWLRGDLVGLLTAAALGADTVVTPVSSSTAVERSRHFAKVIRTRIGSPYVIEAMCDVTKGSQTVVGYEANGGVLLGSDIVRGDSVLRALPTRDAILPMLALLEMSAHRNCKMSELGRELPQRYTHSDRLQNFQGDQAIRLIGALEENVSLATKLMGPQSGLPSAVDTTDGYRLTFDSGDIVHLRASGNAPELRCYTEADSQQRARELCESCLQRVNVGVADA